MRESIDYLRKYFLLFFCILFTPSILHAQQLFYCPDAHFSFMLPDGWQRLSDKVVEQQKKYIKSVERDANFDKFDIEMFFNRKDAKWPFEFPYFTINVKKTKINETVIQTYISSIQKTAKIVFEEDSWLNKIHKDVLISKPIYDKSKRMMLFSNELTSKNSKGEIVYSKLIMASFFYKDGIVSVNFCCTKDSLNSFLPIVTGIIESFSFDKGYEYK